MSVEHIKYRQQTYNNIIINQKYGNLPGLAAIELNVTELCNRRCIFCPRYDSAVYPNRKLFMRREIIQRLIDQLTINEYSGIITISGFGEPLLNTQVAEYILMLKAALPQCHVEMNTNGDLLDKTTISEIASTIDMLIVDCYDGQHQIVKYESMFCESNFTNFMFRKLWLEQDEDLLQKVNEWNFNNRAGAVTNIEFSTSNHNQCFLPFYRVTIDWNGDIILCCNDWYRQQKGLGNIMNEDFHSLWMSDTYKAIRDNLSCGIRSDSACKNCSAAGTLLGKESVDIINQYQIVR